MDSLGDRIKGYEAVSQYKLVKRMPVIIRVDGRAFHTFTKNMEKPFDSKFIGAMNLAAYHVSKSMQGFKIAYVQSDEVTFCITDYDLLDSQGWFGYELSKILSVSSSLMSSYFINIIPNEWEGYPTFDSRAFNVPVDDVANVFLWRAKDWKRNSLQMYARSVFSHKELLNKSQKDMHEMLYSVGRNWATDLGLTEKNGTFLIKNGSDINILNTIEATYSQIDSVINPLITPKE